jgi:GTPase
MVWNKIDLLPGAEPRIERIDAGGRWRAWVSAARGLGLEGLREAIDHQFDSERVHRWVTLPAAAGRLRARLYTAGAVASERNGDEGMALEIDAPRSVVEPLYGLPDGDGELLRAALQARRA